MARRSQHLTARAQTPQSVRDDINRLVELTSPDLGNPFLFIYDLASRLTDFYEDLGGGTNQLHHTFTYDNLGRQTVADYAPRCAASGTNHAWIQRSFDALPTGVTCPAGMTNACTNVSGRLAYVDAVLLCSSTYTDGSLDQFTYYAYDDAGRVIEEYITDDSGRTADHIFAYTKNGAISQVTMPSGAVLGWTYGSTGNNSDTDLVTGTWRTSTSTPITDTVTWNPFGPLKAYNWEVTVAGNGMMTSVTRNNAYRMSNILNGGYQVGGSYFTHSNVAISEDLMGRVTSRVFTPQGTSDGDSYYLYDEQSRVLCETTDSVSTCPSSGTDLKNNHNLSPPFMNAGDWKQVLRPENGSTGLTHNINTQGTNYGTSHQITDVYQSDGTPTFGHTALAYDARGNRTSDDNTTTFTHDERNYTYDPRRNVINVRGEYYNGTAWHFYDVASAFDAKNRRVYKSFYDETTLKTASWYFYYDALDRLTEVRYTPDTSSSGTYSLFQLFWIGDRLTLYWQVDYPSVTTSKRYTSTDETGRIFELVNWPSSGDGAVAWLINTNAWANLETNLGGAGVYQPMLFAGQYQDVETTAYENDGATIHRPGLALNGFRTYDPFTGGYLQVDPLVHRTWSSYVYAGSDPVGKGDVKGLENCPVNECIPIDDTAPAPTVEDPGGGGDIFDGFPTEPPPKDPNNPPPCMIPGGCKPPPPIKCGWLCRLLNRAAVQQAHAIDPTIDPTGGCCGGDCADGTDSAGATCFCHCDCMQSRVLVGAFCNPLWDCPPADFGLPPPDKCKACVAAEKSAVAACHNPDIDPIRPRSPFGF